MSYATYGQLNPGQLASGDGKRESLGMFLNRFNPFRDSDKSGAAYGSDRSEDATSVSKPSGGSAGSAAPSPVPGGGLTPKSEQDGTRMPNVFSAGLVIDGNVTSETDILIRGTVRGDIVCQGDIELGGDVTGDVEGKNIRIVRGTIHGNVFCGESLSVEGSTVVGNLAARTARINNRVEGDITVGGSLVLLREADIRGNIFAASLSVEEGAVLSGQVTISREQGNAPLPGRQKKNSRTAPGADKAAPAASSATPAPAGSPLSAVASASSKPSAAAAHAPISAPVAKNGPSDVDAPTLPLAMSGTGQLPLPEGVIAAASDGSAVLSIVGEENPLRSKVKTTVGVMGIALWALVLLRNMIVAAFE